MRRTNVIAAVTGAVLGVLAASAWQMTRTDLPATMPTAWDARGVKR